MYNSTAQQQHRKKVYHTCWMASKSLLNHRHATSIKKNFRFHFLIPFSAPRSHILSFLSYYFVFFFRLHIGQPKSIPAHRPLHVTSHYAADSIFSLLFSSLFSLFYAICKKCSRARVWFREVKNSLSKK